MQPRCLFVQIVWHWAKRQCSTAKAGLTTALVHLPWCLTDDADEPPAVCRADHQTTDAPLCQKC